jgi:hypothetical protein
MKQEIVQKSVETVVDKVTPKKEAKVTKIG